MKSKTLVWAYLLILSLGTILSLYIPKNAAVAKESVVIPGDAIRLRILANSDLDSDQALKRDVRDAVNAKITVWVKDLTSLQKAKAVIKSKLPVLQATAEQVVHEHGSNQAVKVQFGKVQFPTKLYGDFLYPAGEYQAVLITLGKGEGANWWCVLYPPLCFLDFSNGVAVSDGFEDHKAKAETVSEAKASDQGSSVEGSSLDQPSSDTSSNSKTSGTGEQQTAVNNSKPTSDATSSTVDEKTDNQDHTQMSAGTLNASAAVEDPSSVDNSSSAVDSPTSLGDTRSSDADNSSSKVDTPSSTVDNSSPEVDTRSSDVDNSSSKVDTSSSTVDNSSPEVDTRSSVADNSSSGTGDQDTAVSHQDKQTAPVYTSEDEQPVKVKFFIVELFQKLFE